MEDINFLRKVGKGTVILLFGTVLSKFLAYVFRAIVAKHYGASVYGLLVLAIAIASLVASTALLGLDGGLLRYVAYHLGNANKKILVPMISSVVKVVFPISLFLGLATFVFAKEVSTIFFHKPELALFLQIAAFLIPLFGLYSIFDKLLQAFQDAKGLVIARNFVDPLGKVVLLGLFLLLGVGIWGVVFAYVFGVGLSAVVMFFLLRKKMPGFGSIFFRQEKLSRELVSYSLPLLFSSFLIMLLSWIDIIILGIFVDSASVGIYDAASVTSRLTAIVPLALSTMFMPAITEVFAKNHSADYSNIGRLYKHISKWGLILLLPASFFLAMFSKTVLTSFFGPEFGAGAISLVMLVTVHMIWGLNLLSSNVLEMFKRTKVILYNCILSAAINLVLNFILIPKMGIVGAAIATSISTLIITLVYVIEASYLIGKSPIDFYILKLLFSIAIPVIALVILFHSFIIEVSLFYAVIIGFVFTLAYFILLFVTRSFDSEDIELFKLALRRYNPIK